MAFTLKLKSQKVLSPQFRAAVVAFFSCFFALLYHICALIAFSVLKISPLITTNIFSIIVFLVLCILVRRAKSYIILYTIASLEVIFHQILAEYLLGSYTSFHFFIFLIGLLPFLVFEDNFKFSLPFTLITTTIFLLLCGCNFKPHYVFNPTVFFVIRMINTMLGFTMIVFVIFIYIYVVHNIEDELEKHNKNLENEIRLAAFIQQNFYKHDNLGFKDWDLAYYTRPLAGVSGDLYDFYESKNGTEGVGIFDVSGHGISSGLVTMLVKNIIQQEFSLQEENELWEIMNTINDRVIAEKGKIQNYLTGILIRLKENRLEIVNAGHPYPIVYSKKTGKCSALDKASDFCGGTIGIAGFPAFFYSQFIELEAGDEIILFTDGVSDVTNKAGKRFIAEKLPQIIEQNAAEPTGEQLRLVTKGLKDFREGIEVNDDMTLIILKRS